MQRTLRISGASLMTRPGMGACQGRIRGAWLRELAWARACCSAPCQRRILRARPSLPRPCASCLPPSPPRKCSPHLNMQGQALEAQLHRQRQVGAVARRRRAASRQHIHNACTRQEQGQRILACLSSQRAALGSSSCRRAHGCCPCHAASGALQVRRPAPPMLAALAGLGRAGVEGVAQPPALRAQHRHRRGPRRRLRPHSRAAEAAGAGARQRRAGLAAADGQHELAADRGAGGAGRVCAAHPLRAAAGEGGDAG